MTERLVKEQGFVALASTLDQFAYARSRPLLFSDPLGLSPCQYYDRVCREVGCDYHCNVAPKYCKLGGSQLNWFDTQETKDCIRICLVVADSIERHFPRCECNCPGKPGCLNEKCITDYHETCFQTCGSRSPWILLTAGRGGLFLGPGAFFPGGGC